MKKLFFTIILFCLILLYCYTDDGEETIQITINDIITPSAPAFMLLDKSPILIEHPASLREFVVSISQSTNEQDYIPRNIAIECTPYWFFPHPDLDSMKYLGIADDSGSNDTTKNNTSGKYCHQKILHKLLSSCSLSFASVSEPGNGNSPDILNLSLGLRSTMISVYKGIDAVKIKKAENAIFEALKVKADLISKLDPAGPGYEEKLEAILNTTFKPGAEETLQALVGKKPFFSLDAAVAGSGCIEENDISTLQLGRVGAWMTGCLSPGLKNNNYFNILLMFRYLFNNNEYSIDDEYIPQHMIDAGGKTGIDLERYLFSGEFIYRLNLEDVAQSNYRAVGHITYKLQGDMCISYTIGKDFGTENNFISCFTMQWTGGDADINIKENK